MKKTNLKFLILSLFLCLLFAYTPVSALAEDEKPTNYETLPVVGVIPTSNDCPITVTSAKFTFNVGAFPNEDTDLSTLNSEVIAEYTFSNPTTSIIIAKFKLVLGKLPAYGTNAFADSKISVKVGENNAELTKGEKDGEHFRTFDVSLEAGASTTIQATYPLYPGTDNSYKPVVYSYSLANKGIASWKTFGNYSLCLQTQYPIVGSSIISLKTDDKGFAEIKFENERPEEDFQIFLCTVASPKNPAATRGTILLVVIMILITFGPILITFIIILIIRKVQKYKQKKRYENRYNFYR